MDGSRSIELAELLDEVRRIEVQTTRLVTGVLAGGYSSVFRGAGIEFDEVREYAEGDDPRSVDWNVTARAGRPFVKKYKDERELSVLFVLDLSASMAAGGFGPRAARRIAARAIACLALSAVENNDRVGLIAFGAGVERYVPAKKGTAHVLRILRDCLGLPVAAGAADPTAALELAARVVRRHSIVFVVSDFLGDDHEAALTRCARWHDTIAIRIEPPELRRPPTTGILHVADPETGRVAVVDWADPAAQRAYAARVTAWEAATTAMFRRAKVDAMVVPVPAAGQRDVVVRPILDFFRMREQRAAKR